MNITTKILASTALVTASLTASANASYTCLNNIEQVDGLNIYTSSFCGSTGDIKDFLENFERDGVLPVGITLATPEQLMKVTIVANTPDRNRNREETVEAPEGTTLTTDADDFDIEAEMDELESSLRDSTNISAELNTIIGEAETSFLEVYNSGVISGFEDRGIETFYVRTESYDNPEIMRRYSDEMIDRYTAPEVHEELRSLSDTGYVAMSVARRLRNPSY